MSLCECGNQPMTDRKSCEKCCSGNRCTYGCGTCFCKCHDKKLKLKRKSCAVCRASFAIPRNARTAESRTLCQPCRKVFRAKQELKGGSRGD